MKVSEAFREVINGYNVNNAIVKNEYAKEFKVLQKDSIQYTNIIKDKLVNKKFSNEIKDKFFLHPRDILIFVKKPYRVGTYPFELNGLEVVIPNNFIILRDINMDYYSYIFVANYLEKIGIAKCVKKNSIEENLTIKDIKEIDLPDISKEKQMTISKLLKTVNKRSAIYSSILENDDKIIRYVISEITGEKND